ncbi:hypothetical protein ZWY2020_057158 [Hordeum vulgare]|nr:hypothetical protein ZWY2020_057158 [Hordeum vulgare]
MFDTRSSSKHAFLGGKKHEEIDELLVKVLKLTEELPTSGDKLRTIAGFFPAVHGPREEDIVAVHNFDCGMVEGLKIAVTNIRSSFAQLKESHEAGVESAGIDASGEVGLGHRGVAACDVHKHFYNGSEKDEDLADASSPPDVVVDKA